MADQLPHFLFSIDCLEWSCQPIGVVPFLVYRRYYLLLYGLICL